jgi:hypothetical protein
MPTVTPRKFVESEDFWAIRADANQQILQKIGCLSCPVAMIGSHSDVSGCEHPNITVIHPSWQQFLARQVGVELEHGWEAEVAHRWISELWTSRSGARPSHALMDRCYATLQAWHKIERGGLFNWAYPNRLGTELFAREIGPGVEAFIHGL